MSSSRERLLATAILAIASAALLSPSSRGAPGETSAAGYSVRWHPEAGGYVDDGLCLDCHEDQALPHTQVHGRIESFEVGGLEVGCQGCHGPGERHSEELDLESIQRFGPGGLGDRACMSCHARKGLGEWYASTHAVESVGCSDCHSVHTTPVRATLAGGPSIGTAAIRTASTNSASAALDSCRNCHGEVLARFQLPSHHPLREGKMTCASCHDVHSAQEQMLKTALRNNDLCYSCHQDKEGPFIFEHEPVQEDCSSCHVAHGSVADDLLVANEPALCLQCHEPHFHSAYRASDDEEVDVGGIERENPFGARGFNIAFTTSCSQCHSQVHGSDLPSQTVPSRGRGLTQ